MEGGRSLLLLPFMPCNVSRGEREREGRKEETVYSTKGSRRGGGGLVTGRLVHTSYRS